MSNIVVPQLGESVVEARIARWLKKAGDRVEVGEPVVELETEKIDLEVSAEKSGVIASIARQEGEDVKIGELLAVVDESGAAGDRSATPATSAASARPAATPVATARRIDRGTRHADSATDREGQRRRPGRSPRLWRRRTRHQAGRAAGNDAEHRCTDDRQRTKYDRTDRQRDRTDKRQARTDE